MHFFKFYKFHKLPYVVTQVKKAWIRICIKLIEDPRHQCFGSGSVPKFVGHPDPDPSLFVRIQILPFFKQ
jgi:hypothetical protein